MELVVVSLNVFIDSFDISDVRRLHTINPTKLNAISGLILNFSFPDKQNK